MLNALPTFNTLGTDIPKPGEDIPIHIYFRAGLDCFKHDCSIR